MKILFLRHGESMDDIYEEFGGWGERELSPQGVKTALELTKDIKGLQKQHGNFKVIYTSPLTRCYQTAEIIESELEIPSKLLPYLKERNTYGLLSGVKKKIVKKEYPELYDLYEKQKYIPGAERYKDFAERIKILMHHLQDNTHENIVCVTHGHLITVILEEILGLYRDKIGNGSWLYVETSNKDKNKFKIIDKKNITYTDDPQKISQKTERSKFKKF